MRAAQLAVHLQALIGDLARQPLDVAHHVRPGARQPDVGGLDPEPIDQVQDAQLLVDDRAADRRRLQPVAQRLVIEHDDGAASASSVRFQS